MLLVILVSAVWLVLAMRHGRLAVWLLLIWVPVMGWVQLNVFGDSSATVLIYEFLIIGIYVAFGIRAVRSPERAGPPPVVKYGIPFVVWTLLLTPMGISINGLLLTLLGLRTYLLPLPLIWIGYRAFESRREVENLGWLLSALTACIAVVAVVQLSMLTTVGGTVFEVPLGYGVAGVIRPPGTFSSAGHYGMYILFAVPLAMGLLSLSTALWKRIGFAAGLGGGIIGLMANTQRATIMLLAIALPLMAILARRRQAMSRMAVAAVLIVLALFVGSQFTGTVFQERIASIGNDLSTNMVVNPMVRLRDALRSPVWGSGLGIAAPGSGRLLPETSFTAPVRTGDSIKPSESFMAAMIYNTGTPGLVLFYLLIGALLYRGLLAVRACRGTDLGTLAAAILVFQIVIVLQSWAYDPLHYPPSRVLFWLWGGALLALPKLATGVVSRPAASPKRGIPTRRLTRPELAPGRRRAAV